MFRRCETVVVFIFAVVDCVCSVSEAGDRGKRGGEEPQSKRHVDHERDHSDHSSRDSDHDRLSAYDRQMVRH